MTCKEVYVKLAYDRLDCLFRRVTLGFATEGTKLRA